MAYGDMGIFTPAESAYATPGAFTESLRAEATKRAAYLSSMDQFYEQLEESQRQFDETLSFKESSFASTLGFHERSFDEKLAWEKESFEKTLEFEEESLDKKLELEERQLDISEKSVDFGREGDMLDYFASRERTQAQAKASRSGGERIYLGYSSPQRTLERMTKRSERPAGSSYRYTPGAGPGGTAGFSYASDSEYGAGGQSEWD